jgi:hypothetical protein
MTVTRWSFYDPFTTDTYTFEINPNDGGSRQFKRNFVFQATAAADGKTLVFEGRADPQTVDFSGTLLTEDQFNAFQTWWEKRNQILMTDDLGRTSWIVIQEFQPKRVRAVQWPWKHTYTVKATVVDYP